MPDCTHTRSRRSRYPRRLRGSPRPWAATAPLALILALALLVVWAPADARADGDPASDVLASQSLFLPQDAGIPAAQQQRLAELLHSASAAGFPLRVALVAGPADLGSITELWRRPREYASFLGQELGLVYHGLLLVVMPNGYGTYRVGTGTGTGTSTAGGNGGSTTAAGAGLRSVASLPAPGSGMRLATAALTAVQRLAVAAGHNLPPGARTAGPTGSVDLAAWLAFAAGAGAVLAAWAASLRARPLRAGNKADAASS